MVAAWNRLWVRILQHNAPRLEFNQHISCAHVSQFHDFTKIGYRSHSSLPSSPCRVCSVAAATCIDCLTRYA